MVRVSAEEAETQLLQLMDEALSGEAVFITRDGKEIVQLVPVEQSQQRPQFGSARQPGSASGLIHMTDDFDEPLEDFKEYM